MLRCLLVVLISFAMASMSAADTVRAAVAISLKDAVMAIRPDYEAATGDKLELAFGASGQLMLQIRSGAPIDVFVSAAPRQVDDLIASGHVDEKSVRIVAGNRLVLIVPATLASAPVSFEALAQVKDGRIAIGEPASVPAGDYASQVFAALRLSESLKNRLVFGTNVRQVLSYVEHGEVVAGVVYWTDAAQAGDKVRVVATANPRWHQPILYPAAAIKGSNHAEAANRFLDYLQSPKARDALTSRGFTTPASDQTKK